MNNSITSNKNAQAKKNVVIFAKKTDKDSEGDKEEKASPDLRFSEHLASLCDTEKKPLYVAAGKALYHWHNDLYWKPLQDEESERLALNWLSQYAPSKATAKSAISCVQTAGLYLDMLPMFEPDENKPQKYDPNSVVLPVRNGYLHVKKSDKENLADANKEVEWVTELLKPDRNLGITHLINCEYDPFAEAPTFTKFIEEILPDPDVRNLVREYAGYTLFPDCRHQIVQFWTGEGQNGKSALARIISNVHKKSVAIALDNLRKDGLEGLLGGSLAIADEIPSRIDEQQYKMIASGGILQIPRKYRSTLSVRIPLKIIALGNNPPAPSDQSDGFWRRTVLVNFGYKIKKKDAEMEDRIIRDELSGVLNWMMSGLVDLMKRGCFPDTPAAVTAAIHLGKRESNNVLAWVEDEMVCFDEHTTQYNNGWPSKNIVYAAYVNYCGLQGSLRVGAEKFWKRLESALDHVLPKNHMGYCNETVRERLVPIRIDMPSLITASSNQPARHR